MKLIYFDTSVYVKVFKREKGTKFARQLISLAENTNQVKIFLSYWVINQSIGIIDRTQNQRHKMSKERKDTIIATILKKIIDYSESNIVVVPLNHKFVRDSVNYIYKYKISADDALYVCVAHKHNCKYFICKDDYLKKQIDNKINGLRVLDITNKMEMTWLLNQVTNPKTQ